MRNQEQRRMTVIKNIQSKKRAERTAPNLVIQMMRWFLQLLRLIRELLSSATASLRCPRLFLKGGEEAEAEKSGTKKNGGNQEHPKKNDGNEEHVPKQDESGKNSAKPGESEAAVVPPPPPSPSSFISIVRRPPPRQPVPFTSIEEPLKQRLKTTSRRRKEEGRGGLQI